VRAVNYLYEDSHTKPDAKTPFQMLAITGKVATGGGANRKLFWKASSLSKNWVENPVVLRRLYRESDRM
jgi:hypothetical protein